MSDFVFNVEMDESLFSVEPPVGYTVQNMKVDVSPPEEKDLIATFREYGKLSGGAFPDSLDLQTILEMVGKKLATQTVAEKPASGKEKPNKEQMQRIMEAQMQKIGEVQLRLQRGLLFALAKLPPDADAHYAGKGVSFGAADAPIFWYRPKDSKKYRVIFADLSVRDADTPPNVAKAQQVPAPSSPKK